MGDPEDQSSPKDSTGGTLKKLGGALLSESRRSAQAASVKAKLQKLKRHDLPKAHQALGKAAYEKDILRGMFPSQYETIDALRLEIEAKRSHVEPGEGSLAKLKQTALDAATMAEAEALRIKLNGLFRELGGRAENIDEPALLEDQEGVLDLRQTIAAEEERLEELAAEDTHVGEYFHESLSSTRHAVWSVVNKHKLPGWLRSKRMMAVAALILLLGLGWFFFGGTAGAKIKRADELAAHPGDPTKPENVQGVPDSYFDTPEKVEAAVEACIAAVEAKPDDPRQRFQLGRVLLIAGLEEEAFGQLAAAADGGHAGAMLYLAQLSEDPEESEELLGKAMASGFSLEKGEVAQASAKEVIPDFTAEGYHNAVAMAAFYRSDLNTLNKERAKNVILVRDLAGVLHQNCPLLEDPAMGGLLLGSVQKDIMGGGSMEEQGYRVLGEMLRSMANPQQMMDDAVQGEAQTKAATQDAIRLLQSYGCDGDVTRKVYSGMRDFLRNKGQN